MVSRHTFISLILVVFGCLLVWFFCLLDFWVFLIKKSVKKVAREQHTNILYLTTVLFLRWSRCSLWSLVCICTPQPWSACTLPPALILLSWDHWSLRTSEERPWVHKSPSGDTSALAACEASLAFRLPSMEEQKERHRSSQNRASGGSECSLSCLALQNS